MQALAIIGGRARFHRRILLEISEIGDAAALTFGEIVLGSSATCSHFWGTAHSA